MDYRHAVLEGYGVVEAFSGEPAVRLIAAIGGRIAAIVSDGVMPAVGGVQTVRQLAALRPDLRVVFMSGDGKQSLDIDALVDPGRPTRLMPIRGDFGDGES